MPREQRSRITLLLPTPTTLPEFLQVDAVLTQLIEICGGVTVTSLYPPTIEGWWTAPDGHTVQDANILILGDVLAPADSQALNEYLGTLKRNCQEDFGQDLVWLTIHAVERMTTHDH